MKIQLISDIHLEFGRRIDIQNAGADVLVLAGDICMANKIEEYKSFFKECAEKFNSVVYVMGNHEHYKHTFNDTADVIRKAVADLPNFHFLDNESVVIDGVKFIGTTLWTDMNDKCPLTMDYLRKGMSDYHVIVYRNGDGNFFKFKPQTSFMEHCIARSFIDRETKDGPCVVVTHHAPSFQSIHETYKNEQFMNGGFASDLEDMIHIATDNIKLWCHGHMHNDFDYMVGDTRVVCNPVGYPGERETINTNLVLEI